MNNKDFNIKYTDSGKEQMKIFQEEQKLLLEKIINKSKYVLGDESVEITGSDIFKAKKKLLVVEKQRKYYPMARILSLAYIIIGVFLIIAGFSYNYFIKLFETNKEQALIIIMGFSITLIGSIFYLYIKVREKKYYNKRSSLKSDFNDNSQNINLY